ncbi:MAG: carbon-nitrogen hydrolase family protein [Gammaproteobacteria bacterium]|nr:carbon-nitrogen hydrolase family protein [Gammaproteobacteria bacterium]
MSKLAAIQLCSTADVDENLSTAAKLIAQAAQHGAQLVVLPEMFAIMGKTDQDKLKVKEPFGNGKIQNFLAGQAKKHNIWIIGGTIPIACDDPHKVRAACIVYNADGEFVARYDKAHLFDVILSPTEFYKESDTTEAGDKLVIIPTPFGKIGLAVCYDIRFSDMFLEFFKQGAEIIAIPTAFTEQTGKAHWRTLVHGRAIENFSYIIGACQYGTHANNRRTYGHSLAVDPWGITLDEITTATEGIVYCDVDLEYLHAKRRAVPVGRAVNGLKLS